jgi:hypothetical protein
MDDKHITFLMSAFSMTPKVVDLPIRYIKFATRTFLVARSIGSAIGAGASYEEGAHWKLVTLVDVPPLCWSTVQCNKHLAILGAASIVAPKIPYLPTVKVELAAFTLLIARDIHWSICFGLT